MNEYKCFTHAAQGQWRVFEENNEEVKERNSGAKVIMEAIVWSHIGHIYKYEYSGLGGINFESYLERI